MVRCSCKTFTAIMNGLLVVVLVVVLVLVLVVVVVVVVHAMAERVRSEATRCM